MTATFKEIKRLTVAPNRDIVISELIEKDELKGLNINCYVTTEKYTGFTKGTFVPVDKIGEFKEMIKNLEA